MPSPLCEVKDADGSYQSTTNGVDVTPGNTVTVHLIDSSADTWSIECVYTDDESVAATVNAGLTINGPARTATFTAPAAGRGYIFRSVVNSGVGPNGRVMSSYTTTFGVFTLTSGGRRVIVTNETVESDATFGWAPKFNGVIRDVIELPEDLEAGDLLYVDADEEIVRIPIGTAGQVLTVVDGLPAWADPPEGGGGDPELPDVSGLLVDYNPAAGATTSSGGTVIDSLADQSGTGDTNKNLTRTGTVAYNATDVAYGGKPTMEFSTAGRLEGAADWTSAATQPVTIYIVGEASNSGGRVVEGQDARCAILNLSGEWNLYSGTGFVAGSASDPTVPSVVCGVFNGASSAIYVGDPATAEGTGNPGTNGIDRIVLGAYSGGTVELTGKIARVLAYSGAHDEATRTLVMDYLAAEYEI